MIGQSKQNTTKGIIFAILWNGQANTTFEKQVHSKPMTCILYPSITLLCLINLCQKYDAYLKGLALGDLIMLYYNDA